jgi:hypothetical protein
MNHPAIYIPDYDTAARALSDGDLDDAHAASTPGPWREAVRRETDRRFYSNQQWHADFMAAPNSWIKNQFATA